MAASASACRAQEKEIGALCSSLALATSRSSARSHHRRAHRTVRPLQEKVVLMMGYVVVKSF